MATTIDRKAFRFFHSHAGGIVGQHAITAASLARAEASADLRGWEYEWEWDDCAASDGCQDDYCSCAKGRPKEHECLWVRLKDADGNTLASLGGIWDPDRSYRRVVEAELASEVIWEEEKAWGGRSICPPLRQ